MADASELYGKLKEDLRKVADPLFRFAQGYVRRHGRFLPVGSVLTGQGEVVLQAGSNGEDVASSEGILPILHDGLRTRVSQQPARAIGVCEWVKVTPEAQGETDAIKVLVEHEEGLCVAFYMPCRKRWLRGWEFGEIFVVMADPEVRPWGTGRAR
jgi:hypothetical protein